MGNFNNIQEKLKEFIKKYYTNELIKGLILFSAFGLLYFLITLFIEYLFWLAPSARSILFYAFIFVEIGLLVKFIITPVTRLFGLQKGISLTEASRIIGKHFREVDDKLLNVLQLSEDKEKSELLIASIEQKSASLTPIPFKKAISFKNNVRYLKYLSIPLFIWLFTFFTGNNFILNESLDRVVHYNIAYEPPAPFSFVILNENLNSLEGKPFELHIETIGNTIPENVQIHFNEEYYLLKDKTSGNFSYSFGNLKENISFYLEANDVRSKEYTINIIKIPTVVGFEMFLEFPTYTGKKNESILNTGNTAVPIGTRVTWSIKTRETDSLAFINYDVFPFERNNKNNFSYTRRLLQDIEYQIATSNFNLKNYERLNYNIKVLEDEFPKITVKSDIDSISRGPVQFVGQLSDDYGLRKLELVYYNSEDKLSMNRLPVTINKTTFEEFYYVFDPKGLVKLEEGKAYEMYFEVFDNDGVNGTKSSKSKTFTYYNKTNEEITDDLLKEQQQSLDELNKTSKNNEKLNKDLDEFSKKLKKKSELNWNDKKDFDQFLKRQEQYQKMLEEHSDKLQENLDEQSQNEEDETIKNKKDELKKRIEETKELQKKDDLLEQLKKMSEKLDKEKVLDKLDKLTEQNKQNNRSLERLLEMAKRFFVEKKAVQITRKLDSLAKKENKLSDSENNNSKEQEKLNEEFKKIQEDFDELNKENQNLVQPMDFPDTNKEENEIKEEMDNAKKLLEKEEKDEDEKGVKSESKKEKTATKSQKSASKKMKQLSKQMQGAMEAMQGEMIEENIESLRAILENLLAFSFDQEKLMLSLEGVDASHAEFPVKLKRQQVLKENFEHIDDSLYTLSMRVQQMTSKIQKDLTEVHYNIDKSLENIAENRMEQGRSNQQYTMTSANNLADMLSDLLNSLQNPGMGSGKGKGNEISLPDIIQKQGELNEKMKEGMKKGQKEGQNGKEGQGEQMTGEQYQIFKEQNALKQALQDLMNEKGKGGVNGQKALDQMEELEKQLLDKGFNNDVLKRMIRLEHELLELEKATQEQGKDNKRKSETSKILYESRNIPEIKGKKLFFNSNEVLNRDPLPLRNDYKKKVRAYFNEKIKE